MKLLIFFGKEQMTTAEVIQTASEYLKELPGNVFDLLEVTKPDSVDAALNLSRIVTKLSPIVANLIEFDIVEYLNENEKLKDHGHWLRQDPGFPDTIFEGKVLPTPGFEVKAWFPMATEITARFKDSQNHFLENSIYVVMFAWLPEYVIYGKPKLIDIVISSGASVAKARDAHYHKPPHYVILEPEQTTGRTANLQQSNTNGFVFQYEKGDITEARKHVAKWGDEGEKYSTSAEYQLKLRRLLGSYDYRVDTNYAKMDRIGHRELEEFKTRVHSTMYNGMTIGDWNRLLSKGRESEKKIAFEKHLGIK